MCLGSDSVSGGPTDFVLHYADGLAVTDSGLALSKISGDDTVSCTGVNASGNYLYVYFTDAVTDHITIGSPPNGVETINPPIQPICGQVINLT
jgi:hypothetical protein